MTLPFSLHDLLLWWSGFGLLGFAAMGVDKAAAHLRWGDRISERSLWVIGLVGGFLGIIAGALVFHHKTSKGEFWPPIVGAVAIWGLVVALWLGLVPL